MTTPADVDPPPPPASRLASHPRDLATQAAAAELVPWLAEWRARFGLSTVEYLYLLQVLAGRTVQALAVAEREGITVVRPPGGG